MEIVSTLLGSLQIEEQSIFEFQQGLYGLEEYKKYVLLKQDETLPFAYLQSVENSDICLLLADPFGFFGDYEFEIQEPELEILQHPSPHSVSVWVTVSTKDSIKDATANLMAPVVLNLEEHIGQQVVLHGSNYETRTLLFPSQKEGA